MMQKSLGLLLGAWLVCSLAACAGGQTQVEIDPTEADPPLAPGIYRVADGAPVAPEVFFDELEEAKYIFVGESHDNIAHHQVQAMILEGLARRSPGRVALGMEMFQVPFQPPLDEYVNRRIDEATMLQRTEYDERWGFDFDFYRPMTTLMRLQRSAVVALNAPKEVTRQVSQHGLDSLSDEVRASLPSSLTAENPDHRKMFGEAMGSFHNGMDPETFERYYMAQVIWDATMAQSAVKFLEARPDIERIVVVAGMYHVQYGLGIPFHVEALSGVRGPIVIPVDVNAEKPVTGSDVFGKGMGDFVWVHDTGLPPAGTISASR